MKKWILIVVGALLALVALVLGVGALLPVAHTATVSRAYAVPPETVWEAITDVDAFPAWRSAVDGVRIQVPADSSGPPRRWRETGPYGAMTLEVVEAERSRRLVTRIADEGLPFGGTWTYRLEPDAGGTRLTITEDGEVYNVFFRFMSRFVFGHDTTLLEYLDDLDARL